MNWLKYFRPKRRNLLLISLFFIGLVVVVDIFALGYSRYFYSGLKNLNNKQDYPPSDYPTRHSGVHVEHRPTSTYKEAEFYESATPTLSEKETFSAPTDVMDTHFDNLLKGYEPGKLPIDVDPFYQGMCTQYFHDLYDFDDFWGIEPYSGPLDEANMINTRRSVRHVRTYLNCFLRNHVKVDLNVTDLEARLFPAFEFVFPEFTRFDGTVIRDRFPTEDDYKGHVRKRSVKRDEEIPADLENAQEEMQEAEQEAEHEEPAEAAPDEREKEQTEAQRQQAIVEEERVLREKQEQEELEKEQQQREEELERERKEQEQREQELERERTEKERLNAYYAYLHNYSFWNDIKTQANGRGIVVSLGEGRGVFDMIRLIQVLRMQGSTLPIQIVHKGDLGKESMHRLTVAARSPFAVPKLSKDLPYNAWVEQGHTAAGYEAPKPTGSSENHESENRENEHQEHQEGKHHENEHQDRRGKRAFGLGTKQVQEPEEKHSWDNYDEIIYNPQELWFVDTQGCIKNTAIGLFSWFYNKWLAVLFNSFDEMIMMDSDAVPFMKPEEFLDLEGYVQNKAYLFQDRAIDYLRLSPEEAQYMKSLMPSRQESALFRMKPLTDQSLYNPMVNLETRVAHFIESGVLMISRREHLAELLMSLQVQFMKPASRGTYGDKEMFWLGFSVSGNDDFAINPYTAGSLGVKETHNVEKREDGSYYRYNITASIQPTHVGPDRQLLWVNSGLRRCKHDNMYMSDYNSQEEIRSKYPDPEEWHRFLGSPMQANGVMLINRLTAVEHAEVRIHEQGFKQCYDRGCMGYTWCAFDSEDYPGDWVDFDEQTQGVYDRVSRYWNGNPLYFSTPPKLKEALKHLG